MSHVEQFKKAVTEAGAVATRIARGHNGEERLVIKTPGGLITREILLKGELDKDIENATSLARQIVARAKILTADPARKLVRPPGGKGSSESLAALCGRPRKWQALFALPERVV